MDGPRGESPMTAAERDEYSNLILLCPTDHTVIDKAPDDYTVESLHKMKEDHEAWVQASLKPKVDTAGIRWAEIVDQLRGKLSLNTWAEDVSPFFDGGTIKLAVATEQRLRECALWIATRPWPKGQDRLKVTVINLGFFLNELLSVFDERAELHSGGKRRVYPAFYRIPVWDTDLYNSLLTEYKGRRAYLSELVFEITRYINLFGDLVREGVDPLFRQEEGHVTVLAEGQVLQYNVWIPQFGEEDLDNVLRVQSLADFENSRGSRSPRFQW